MMQIIVVIIIIGVIGALLEWAKKNVTIVVIIVLAIAGIFFWGFWTALKVALLIFVLLLICGWIYNSIGEKNEKELNGFLGSSCVQFGYMNDSAWVKKLPQFAGKSYNTSFQSITSQFALNIEKRYITDDSKLTWLDPASNYLKKAFAADVWGLEQIPSPGLSYTHSTPNGKLIQEAMDYISISKIINGKHFMKKVLMEAEAVCKKHNFKSIESLPKYYLHLYTINEYFRERSVSKGESNFETEEMSLDDL